MHFVVLGKNVFEDKQVVSLIIHDQNVGTLFHALLLPAVTVVMFGKRRNVVVLWQKPRFPANSLKGSPHSQWL